MIGLTFNLIVFFKFGGNYKFKNLKSSSFNLKKI